MKKKFVIMLCFVSGVAVSKAKAGNGIENPVPIAAIEINVSGKNLPISRFSEDQRRSVLNPAKWQFVFQNEAESGFYFFNGSKCEILKNVYQLTSVRNATSGISQIENKRNFSENRYNEMLNLS